MDKNNYKQKILLYKLDNIYIVLHGKLGQSENKIEEIIKKYVTYLSPLLKMSLKFKIFIVITRINFIIYCFSYTTTLFRGCPSSKVGAPTFRHAQQASGARSPAAVGNLVADMAFSLRFQKSSFSIIAFLTQQHFSRGFRLVPWYM
jgi:hypothetical protein